jgi:hypothetical protein
MEKYSNNGLEVLIRLIKAVIFYYKCKENQIDRRRAEKKCILSQTFFA